MLSSGKCQFDILDGQQHNSFPSLACFISNTVGRVMGYLTLVRCMKLPKEEDVRKAVRLVVPSLKNITRMDGITSLKNAPIPDQIFIYVLCSSERYTPMDIDTT